MLKRFTALLFLLLLLSPTVVQAQDNVRFATLEVDLWPEYDQPTMLVIYRAQIAPDVALSQEVEITFRIPAAAGEPFAVATRRAGGEGLLTSPYGRQVEGEWAYITIQTADPEIHLEYYDHQLEKQGSDRRYEFLWVGQHAVDSMLVQVQKPVGASEMEVEPNFGEFQFGADGLEYYNLNLGAINAEETVTVNVNYQKENDTLSLESFQQTQTNVPANVQDTVETDSKNILPWILGGAGLVLAAFGVWWLWQSGQMGAFSKQVTPARRAKSKKEKAKAGVYCHQCGKSAAAEDRFCRACGKRLKS